MIGVFAAVAGVFVSVTYSPGPPTYTLTRDALTIHDLFYSATLSAETVDVNHIQRDRHGR